MKTTPLQTQLYSLADGIIREIGGFASISRNPDPTIREKGKTQGTREWALLRSAGVVSGVVHTDEECQYLIDCINQ